MYYLIYIIHILAYIYTEVKVTFKTNNNDMLKLGLVARACNPS